ncbi:copia protein [Tanacetum coccineum]
MDDNRTMAQLLEAPTEGYEDAIVVPEINANNFEIKHGLLNLVQNKQFFGHDKEDPHAHIRYFNKITSTMKFPNVPSTSVKLMLFPFSLEGAARIWLDKEPPRSILTWDDLVSKFINKFFPPSKMTNLRNEITRFHQRFTNRFMKHGTVSMIFLGHARIMGGNFLDKMPRECLKIIESKSKVRNSRSKPVVAKVSTSTSTSGISPDVSELKDMVKALLLDKKNQSQAPAHQTPASNAPAMENICCYHQQKYGVMILEEMINQDIKDSKAYKTYLSIDTGNAIPKKVRKFKKVASPPKKLSPVLEEESAKKPKRVKRSSKKSAAMPTAGVVIKDTPSVSVSKKEAPAKPDRCKGLEVLSKVALSEACQLKKAIKQSKKDSHISHTSGLGDGTDFESGFPDEPQSNITKSWGDSGEEEDDDEYDFDAESDDDQDNEKDDDNDDNDNDDDDNAFNDDDERVYTPKNYELTNEEDIADDSNEDNKEEKDDAKELYRDVNVNLREEDVEMTDADQGGADQHNVFQELGFELVEEEAIADKKEYIDLIDSSMRTIIREEIKTQLPQTLPKVVTDFATHVIERNVTESLEAIVLAKSSSQPKSSYAAAASLLEELYDALVKSYNTEKDLYDSYGEVFMLKRSRDNKDKDQDPPAGSNRGMKRTKSGKDAESSKDHISKESKSLSFSKGTSCCQHKSFGKTAHAEELSYDSGFQQIQEFDTSNSNDQLDVETVSKSNWFKKAERPLTLYRDWNKSKYVDFRPPQTWISDTAHAEKPPTSFDELMDTPIEFSAFVMNRLNIINLTQELLVGPTFNLLKGTYKGRQEYPFDLSKPLPLIKDQGRQVVPVDYFIKNDLKYLKSGSSSWKYMTSTTKTKAVEYDDIQGIKDMVPALWSLVKWYDYGYLEEIKVQREDQQLYKFKEGDFPRLRLQDIEDMLLLLVQKKLSNLELDVIYDFGVALWMFTKRIVILKRVKYLQIAVKSYQKKLNITRPETFKSDISNRTLYTAYNNPLGIIYPNKFQRNRLMRSNELYKFSNGTHTSVRSVLHDIASNLRMEYLPKRKWSNLDRKRSRIMIKAIDQLLFERRLMRNLEKFVGGREYREDLRLLKRTI